MVQQGVSSQALSRMWLNQEKWGNNGTIRVGHNQQLIIWAWNGLVELFAQGLESVSFSLCMTETNENSE